MIPESLLHIISLVWLTIICFMQVVILFFMIRRHRRSAKRKKLKTLYNDFITELILCESEEELEFTFNQPEGEIIRNKWLKQRMGRKVFLKEIIRARGDLSGGAANNIKWLYEKLNLQQDSQRNLSSDKWFKKAAAIQQLAAMDQTTCIAKIFQETNNPNAFIRNEAQVAMVSLAGSEGLRFLNIVNYPVTQWQQLSLLQKLDNQDVNVEDMKQWLASANETIVEFALRLVEKSKCFQLHDELVELLQHCSSQIRHQALNTLKEIADEQTPAVIAEMFPAFSKDEKRKALEIITDHSSPQQLIFLTSLIADEDEAIRFNSLKAIKKISPAWSRYISMRARKNADVIYLHQQKKEII